ncbi:lectin-like domain-containing protein, partial [Aquimonas voraii]
MRSRLPAPLASTIESVDGSVFSRCLLALLLLLAPLFAAAAEPSRPAQPKGGPIPLTFFYESFAGAGSLLNFNGNAYINGTELRLTEAASSQAGSAFNNRRVQLGADYSFSSYFTFRMLNPGGDGADGLTFTVQTSSNSAVTVGGGLGYQGINNSIAVEFDTFVNGGGDADPNHVAIDINGDVSHNVYTAAQGYYAAYGNEFANGNTYHVWVDYNGANQTMEVRVHGNNSRAAAPVVLNKSGINLASILGTNQAFIGFTAATGGSWETHDIQTWYFQNRYEPIDTVGNTYVQASSDATLSSLATSQGSLSPVFSSGVFSYTVNVANAVSSITVTPTVTNAAASVSVNGVAVTSGTASGPIALNVGNNTITVLGVAENGSTQPYTLTVVRAPGAPTVSATDAASSIAQTSATSGGTVTADGGAAITQRGLVFGTSASPTTANSVVVVGGTLGSYSANLSGLAPGVTYFVRAFATNSAGTAYGPEISFTTLKLDQTISFSNPGNQTYSPGGSFIATATASSGLPVTITSASATCSVNATSPATVAIQAAGPCTLNANQAGDGTYNAAPQASQSLTIQQASQAITIDDPGAQTYSAGGSFSVTATGGGSGNPVVLSSDSPAICSVSGSTVTQLSAGTCLLLADQAGDGNYLAAPQASLGVTINPAPTAAAVVSTSAGAEARSNQGFSVDVQVAGADPQGDVTVFVRRADNSTVTSCVASLQPPSAGVATGSCSVPEGTLRPGDLVTQLVASYPGDLNDSASTSPSFAFSVARGDVAISSVVVDASGDRDAVAGEPITVTVSLAAVAPAVGPVTGDGTAAPDVTVTTSETGTGCTIDWDMATSCTLVFTGVNNTSQLLSAVADPDPKRAAAAKAALMKTLQLSYAATADFNASGPTEADPVTVSSAPTVTVLSTQSATGNANSVAGEGVRLTATVTTDAPSTLPPRGRVLFTRDSDVLGQVTLTAGAGNTATAEFVAPARLVGTETYFAFFLNNDDFVGSDDDAEHTTVQASTATMIDAVVPATPEALQTVTVSASVAAVAPGAGTPTGTITISGDDTTGCVITLPATSCELSFASKGSKTLTATYGGDSQFLASGANSGTAAVTVVGIPVTLSLSGSTPSPHYYGTAYTVSYELSGGDGSFGGAVTVTAAPGGASCTGVVTGTSGSCEIVLPNGNAGTYALSGAYAGDSTDAEASSAPLNHTISQATTALVLSGNTVDPIDAAQLVTVSLDLTMTNGVAPLAGTLTVSGDNTAGCAVTLTGGETMPQSCDLSFSVVGSNAISATFVPSDAINVAGSTSNTITYTVVRAITTTEISGFAPASGTAQVGDAVTVSFAVTGGVQPYDGAVTVEYGAGPTACGPVSFDTGTGLGSCEIPATALQLAGDYAVRVAYAGDADDVPSEDSETLGIAKRATATTLASTPADDQQAGQTVTWTVGVSAVGGAATTPLGGEVFVCPSSAPSCDGLSAVCTITL